MKNVVIKYGLISGGILAVTMVAACMVYYKMGFDCSLIIGYTTMLVAFTFIYFGMASYRDTIGGGQIKYGRALSIGLLITVVASICYVITWVILYHTLFPDFMDREAAYMIGKMKAKGASAADIDKEMAQMQLYKEMYKNPVTLCLLTFIEPLPVGIIISIISAFIVRMKKKAANI